MYNMATVVTELLFKSSKIPFPSICAEITIQRQKINTLENA